MRIFAGALLVLLAAAVAGCGGGGGDGKTTTTTSSGKKSLLVQLQEQSFSGEAGDATLTAEGDNTRIVIEMASYAANAQPAHIHKGTCEKLDATPAYALHDVVAGKSTTVVPISLSKLLDGKYAINMHRSAKQLKVYVACGDIAKNAAPAETFSTSD